MIRPLISIATVLVILLGVVSCTVEQQTATTPAPVIPNTSTYGTAAAKVACIREAKTIQLAVDVCMADNGIESLTRSRTIGPGNSNSEKWSITDGIDNAYVSEYLREDIKGMYSAFGKGIITVLSYPGLTDDDITEVNNQLKDT